MAPRTWLTLDSTLVQKDDVDEPYTNFMSSNGIRHHVINMKGTKKEAIPLRTMKAILRLVLNRENHPVLIHCNHGKVISFTPHHLLNTGTNKVAAPHWLCGWRGPQGDRLGADQHCG